MATGASVTEPVAIEFTTPMNERSVAAAVTIDPPVPVDLTWDAAGDTLTISPRTTWAAGAYHTVSVQAGALAASGQPLVRPARAAFLTRPPTTATLETTKLVGARASVATSFSVTFAGPVDPASVMDAIRLQPSTPGTIEATGSPTGPVSYAFVPSEPLAPDTAYRLQVTGVRDQDGLVLAPQSIAIRTVKAPGVIRFRPRDDSQAASRDAAISVRFTEPMDRQATAKAFSVRIGGKAIKGKVSWAESNTVLIFTPATALPYAAAVVAKVDITAQSATGAPLVRSVRAIFNTISKPRITPVSKPSSPVSGSGGGAVGSGSWTAVENYYLRLMNCTRTGGWITSGGACSSPGGRSVAALRIDTGISAEGLAPVREAPRDGRGLQPLHRRQPRATGWPAPGTRAIAGPRTSAAAPGTRARPSSAPISSSRARSRTAAGTTSIS